MKDRDEFRWDRFHRMAKLEMMLRLQKWDIAKYTKMYRQVRVLVRKYEWWLLDTEKFTRRTLPINKVNLEKESRWHVQWRRQQSWKRNVKVTELSAEIMGLLQIWMQQQIELASYKALREENHRLKVMKTVQVRASSGPPVMLNDER